MSKKLFNENGTWNRENADKYSAILELDKKLTEANIPHVTEPLMDGWLIVYPNHKNRTGDVVEHCGSYGSGLNLMESMGFGFNDVQGFLTVDAAFAMFQKEHESRKGGGRNDEETSN